MGLLFSNIALKHFTEAYSLHRKLAGAILLCIRLRATIHCRDVLEEAYNNFDFD